MATINAPAESLPALVYCRVSTRSMVASTSLTSQRAACVARAEELGYAVTRVTEEAYTGAELFDRPQLSRDRADIRAGKYKAMIIYAVDRLSRNAAHLAILSDELDRAGCRLIFVTEDFDDPAAGTPSRSDEAYAAEVERRQLGERVSRGRRAMLLQGRPVLTGWNLYGYRPDRANGIYVIHEPEAAVVRRVFSMCAAGSGTYTIAATFNREGLPTPKSEIRRGAKWSSSGISNILNNPSYMGEEYCLKTKRGPGGRDYARHSSERVRLPDGVRPAIISREVWESCQQGISARAARMTNRRECPALLRGHIFCAECGAHMIRNHYKRGKYEYLKYRCGSRYRPFETACQGEGVSVEPVQGWAWEQVKLILSDRSCIERALAHAVQSVNDLQVNSDLEAARSLYERHSVSLRAMLAQCEDLAESSPLRPPIERAVAGIKREGEQLEKTIAELESRAARQGRGADELRRLVSRCALMGGVIDSFTFEDQRLAMRALAVKIYANGEDPARWRCEALASAGTQRD